MKKHSFKFIFVTALAFVMVFSLTLFGCAKNDSVIKNDEKKSSDEKVALTFFGYKYESANLAAIESAIQGFKGENSNVDISYESLKGDAYWEAFDKRDEAGVLDDVFMMHHDHVISMSKDNKLADLSDLPGIDNFSDLAKGQFTNSDGSIYFLPTSNSTYNLYINTDLLSQHGQEVPTNWSEFKAVCDYFVSQGITPIIANNKNSLTTVMLSKGLYDLYQLPNDQVEAKLAEFNKNPKLYADAVAPGVEMVGEMIASKWIDCEEALKTNQTSDDLDLFLEGTRPFMITGGWASSRVMAKNPTFTYGVYPYPILEDGSVLPGQVDTCISVNANSENLEHAKAFVSYLIKPEIMWEYCDTQASFSPLKDNKMPSEKTLAPSVDYLSNGRAVLRAEYRLSLPTEAALTAASKALLNGSSINEAQNELLSKLNS